MLDNTGAAQVQAAALEAAVIPDLGFSGVQAAALEAAVIPDLGFSGVQAAALEAAVIPDLGFSGVQAAALEVAVLTASEAPTAVLSDITGTVGTLATFNGSASVGETFRWVWTSLPAGSALSNYPHPLPDNGVGPLMADNVVLYHFQDNGDDSSGSGNNLTLSNSPSFVDGKIGKAIDFNGTNETAFVNNASVRLTGPMSLFTWIYLDALTDNVNVIRCGGAGEAPANNLLYFLQLEGTSGSVLYIHEYGPGNNQSVVVSGMVTAGQWIHIGFVRDATAKTVKFYRDGQEIQTFSYTHNADGGSSSPLYLGSSLGSSRFMNGRLDEFALWSRALTQSEVTEVYEEGAKVGLGSSTSTATFTPDVAGTYTVQFTSSRGGYADASVTRDAVISSAAPPSTGIGNMAGASLYQRSLAGKHFLIPFTGIDPSEDLE